MRKSYIAINSVIHYVVYFIYFVLVIIVVLLVREYYFPIGEKYIGPGFADDSDSYILPKVYKNFITEQENKYIIETASPFFETSGIISETGYDDQVRKSETAWIDRNDPVVKPIIRRVCDLVGVPFENAESLQVVKYKPNGFYKPHHDSFCYSSKEDYEAMLKGGHRVITMLIYLTSDFDGGSTKFPNLDLELKPSANSGILFYPLQKNGKKCHPKALHGGMPVISGEKYIANVWLREREREDESD